MFIYIPQICFAARISREINDQSVKYETIQVEAGISNVTIPVETKNVNGTAQLKGNSTKVETVKSDVSPEESSPEETLEEAAESLSKILTEKEKVKFNQILNEFKKAKTLNETVDGFVRNILSILVLFSQ